MFLLIVMYQLWSVTCGSLCTHGQMYVDINKHYSAMLTASTLLGRLFTGLWNLTAGICCRIISEVRH